MPQILGGKTTWPCFTTPVSHQTLPLALPHLQLLLFRLGASIQCLAHLPEPGDDHGDSSYPEMIFQSSGLTGASQRIVNFSATTVFLRFIFDWVNHSEGPIPHDQTNELMRLSTCFCNFSFSASNRKHLAICQVLSSKLT